MQGWVVTAIYFGQLIQLIWSIVSRSFLKVLMSNKYTESSAEGILLTMFVTVAHC